MRTNIFYFLFIIFSSASAQETVKIWDGTEIRNKQSELSIFLPEKPNAFGVSVIICPGGSYYWLDMDNEGFSVAKYLNKQGITAFVLRYRTAMHKYHHPAMIQDLQRSIQLVKENSKEYGIDPEKVGLIGFSAGGHLVGTASTYFDKNFLEELGITPQVSLRPAFTAMIYPVISMTNNDIVHKKSRKNLLSKNYCPELAKMLSLEYNVRSDMPPMFIIQCVDDKTVDYRNAVNYEISLKEKTVPYFFKLYDAPGHGFGINPKKTKTSKETPSWQNQFIYWVEETMNIQLNTENLKNSFDATNTSHRISIKN